MASDTFMTRMTVEDNETITRVGPGTRMGKLMRRYWQPVLLSWELPEPDCAPVRVRILSEDLVAFRDTSDRVGLVREACPHRRTSLWLGRNEENGLRCVFHSEVLRERVRVRAQSGFPNIPSSSRRGLG